MIRYITDRGWGQDGWILAKFSFCIFMDWDKVKVHKDTTRELGQYPAILTKLAWSIKDLLHGIPCLALCFYFCVCRFLLQNVFLKFVNLFGFICLHSCWHFRFSCFLVPCWQRNNRNSFFCHRKYFAIENVRAPAWTSAKFNSRKKNGNLELADSLHLALLGSKSQRRI